MRLLQYSESGEVSIHSFDDGTTPAYAILSHTWGPEADEVIFADLETGYARSKSGYSKILFCGEQARHDGLRYFWIDTCCINKNNKTELAFSIRSMFRWYRNANRCYVYLSDVSTERLKIEQRQDGMVWLIYVWILSILSFLLGFSSDTLQNFLHPSHLPRSSIDRKAESDQSNPIRTLRESRWFTRGWTLQELLAPYTVEFFSKEGVKIGDKLSLAEELSAITLIPASALQGKLLSDFKAEERISWIEHRLTKVEEDRAYSLMGILGVALNPDYGEGKSSAMSRLRFEVKKLDKLLQDLRPSDPQADKKRIEETKGGLLIDSYRWVLDNDTFIQWRHHEDSQLLWVKGDPGKGKTMLLCGVIDELQEPTPHNVLLSYFFCQATDSRVNSATAVLRGLIYMLVHQEPSLVSHVRRQYEMAGKGLFEDMNAWVSLADIFTDMLHDETVSAQTCLVIDALDECVVDQKRLLKFITKLSSVSPRIKWIISSRNWPAIEEQLGRAKHKSNLSLELNADSVAAAVTSFIEHKVCRLAHEKSYTPEVQDVVLQHLQSNANDTFLWVALVCQSMESTPKFETFDQRRALKKLAQFPPGLDSLYMRMLQHIHESGYAEICLQILAVTAILYRPVTVSELAALVKQLEDFIGSPDSVREMVDLCGSFLTIRDSTIYFVHQSAKDFLLTKALNDVFPDGVGSTHRAVYASSLARLTRVLKKDMYSLEVPDGVVKDVKTPQLDPLAVARYPCVYWIDHVCNSEPGRPADHVNDLQDRGELTTTICEFIEEKYLYWLEGLSLCNSIEKGVISLSKLRVLVQNFDYQDGLFPLVQDAHRFITYHKQAIEAYPLQTYASALLFSPANSLIRQFFEHERPEDIMIKPRLSESWNACLQTLEDSREPVKVVASTHDSTLLVSGSDKQIKIWEVSSGACLQTLEGHGHSHTVKSGAFSPDATRLATASDKTVKIWDTSSGACITTLEDFDANFNSIAFSHDLTRLASAFGKTVKIWDIDSNTCMRTLRDHSQTVDLVVFSHDSSRIAAVSDEIVKIWDVRTRACVQTLQGHDQENNQTVNSVAFSHDSRILASASNQIIQIWDISSGVCSLTLKGHSDAVNFVTFSHDLTARLATSSDDRSVKIWDTGSGACLQTLRGHNQAVNAVAFFDDSTRLASTSDDMSIKIWDISCDTSPTSLEDHTTSVWLVVFSRDSEMLASVSGDKTIKIWASKSGACLHTLKGHGRHISSVAFTHDSATLASASGDKTIKIWSTRSGVCLQTLRGHRHPVYSVTYSHDSTRLASASGDHTIKIWDTSGNDFVCIQTLEGHGRYVASVAYSHHSRRLASASADKTVKIWDTSNEKSVCLQTIEGHDRYVVSVAFSHDSKKLASASEDRVVKIWDISSDNNAICLQTLEGYTTNVNSADLVSILEALEPDGAGKELQPVNRRADISADGTWISKNGKRLLWVPPEYRAVHPAVSGRYIGMGTGSGKVWICQLR